MSTSNNLAPRLNCESLEGRDNPSGNVSVFLSGGSLFIQGDGFSNSIRIEQNGFGDIFIFSLDDTTVNGQSAVYVGRGVPNSVQVSMNGGNDRVDVVNLATWGDLFIAGGAGDDLVNIGSVSAGNAIQVNGGDGNDNTFAQNGLFFINTEQLY